MATSAATLIATAAANKYPALSKRDLDEALLAAIAGGGSAGQSLDVSWTPTSVNLANLILLSFDANSAGITSLTFSQTTTTYGFSIGAVPNLATVSFPDLVSVDPSSQKSGTVFIISTCPVLTSVSAPLLTTVGSPVLDIDSNPLLTSISLPALQTVTAFGHNNAITIFNNPSLVNLSLPNYVPTSSNNGGVGSDNYSANALNLASITALLLLYVNSNFGNNDSIDISGGTNAAPTGVAAGYVTTLQGRGVTVTHN